METLKIAEMLLKCETENLVISKMETSQGNYYAWHIEELNLALQSVTICQADLSAPHEDEVVLEFDDILSIVVA